MLKAADALAAAGYEVRGVATQHEPWAAAADDDVRSRRSWPVTVVDYRRQANAPLYWRSGVVHRAARATARAAGADRVPFAIVARAFARVHDALVQAIVAEPCDLIYGGTTGAPAVRLELRGPPRAVGGDARAGPPVAHAIRDRLRGLSPRRDQRARGRVR